MYVCVSIVVLLLLLLLLLLLFTGPDEHTATPAWSQRVTTLFTTASNTLPFDEPRARKGPLRSPVQP
jgi:hypothetical protein